MRPLDLLVLFSLSVRAYSIAFADTRAGELVKGSVSFVNAFDVGSSHLAAEAVWMIREVNNYKFVSV